MKILFIGGSIAALAAFALASKSEAKPPSVVDEKPPTTPKPSIPAATIAYSKRIEQIQTWLNNRSGVINNNPLAVDGKLGAKTIEAIRLFQQNMVTKGKVQKVTGTWGEQTEANALAVYGSTPFNPGSVKTPQPQTQPVNYNQAMEQGRLKALYTNKYIFGIGADVTFREKPSVTAKIKRVVSKAGSLHPLGQIKSVAFETGASGITRTFLEIFWHTSNHGWVNLTDVSIYSTKTKGGKLAGLDLNQPILGI